MADLIGRLSTLQFRETIAELSQSARGKPTDRTLVEGLLDEVELHLIEVRSAQFLANHPWPPGKRLRPMVFLLSKLSIQAAGPGAPSANGRESRLAAAIELLHKASLVHDDIVDRSPTRRGLPSVHSANGDGMAVLIGDYMVFRGMKLILDSATSLLDVALARELTDTGLCIAHGDRPAPPPPQPRRRADRPRRVPGRDLAQDGGLFRRLRGGWRREAPGYAVRALNHDGSRDKFRYQVPPELQTRGGGLAGRSVPDISGRSTLPGFRLARAPLPPSPRAVPSPVCEGVL